LRSVPAHVEGRVTAEAGTSAISTLVRYEEPAKVQAQAVVGFLLG
jgi:hypothetical protein